MAKNDVSFDLPPMSEDYSLTLSDPAWIDAKVRPKQFLHINEAECILCEGCVDICPWKCIHYLSTEIITDTVGVNDPLTKDGAPGFFMVDEDTCTRCQLCIDRCPTGVISIGKFDGSQADRMAQAEVDPWDVDTGDRDPKNGYVYGMRF